MAKLLIFLSFLTVHPLLYAQNNQIDGKIHFFGKIIESPCQLKPYQKIKHNTSPYQPMDIFDNCNLNDKAEEYSPKVSLTKKAITPNKADPNDRTNTHNSRSPHFSGTELAKKDKQKMTQQEAVIYIAEYK